MNANMTESKFFSNKVACGFYRSLDILNPWNMLYFGTNKVSKGN